MDDNSQVNDEINNFRTLVNQWGYAYKWAVVSYVALRYSGSNKLTLLAGRIDLESTLLNAEDIKSLPVEFESDNVVAGREVMQINGKLDQVLSGLDEGKLVVTKGMADIALKRGDSFSANFLPYPPYSVSKGLHQPALHIRGARKWDVIPNIDQLNWELKAAEKPYKSLDELLDSLELPTAARADCTTLEVAANSFTAIHADSKIDSGKVLLKLVVAENVHTEKLRFGYIVSERKSVKRGHIAGSDFRWELDGNIQTGIFELSVDEASVLQALISYDGYVLGQQWITDPSKHVNPRYASCKLFDPDLRILHDFLSGKSKDPGNDFEQGITILFTLLGFSPSHHGTVPKLQDGPDILAFTPRNNIAVIECTTKRLNDKDKMSKLVSRTNQLKERLKLSGHPHLLIQPVIVTALSRSDVSADLPEAGRNGIVVISRDDIKLLLERVALSLSDPEDIFRGFANLIPDKKQPEMD